MPLWINYLVCMFQGRLHIGGERFVSVGEYEGETRVNIRQYVKYGERLYPSKTGVFLTSTQFANFLLFLDEICKDIEEYKEKKTG